MDGLTPSHFSTKRALFFYGIFVSIFVLSMLFFRIVIGPFILALVLSYILNPWIENLEKKGLNRSGIVITAVFGTILLLLLLLWYLIPTILKQSELF